MTILARRLFPREDTRRSLSSAFPDSAPHGCPPRHPGSIALRAGAIAVAVSLLRTANVGGTVVPDLEQQYSHSPKAVLIPAQTMLLPGAVDSNSPAVWIESRGRKVLYLTTSFAGAPSLWLGLSLSGLAVERETKIEPRPPGGNWLEAIVADEHGAWYGFYHNEQASRYCSGEFPRTTPRIGAVRSINFGRTWEDLGTILESPPWSDDCESPNHYFAGGVGDFSVALDPDGIDLYIFYSQYVGWMPSQGIAVAKFPWEHRDNPARKVTVHTEEGWTAASALAGGADDSGPVRWTYPAAAPLFPARDSWHDVDGSVDAFWGPSVHWNTHLDRYVMLLNRASDNMWTQHGIYISYAKRLDDPAAWSPPKKLLDGGRWYPQVFGLENGVGTDKVAGEFARFFMSGSSEYLIRFLK
jgi:hypothetical protein